MNSKPQVPTVERSPSVRAEQTTHRLEEDRLAHLVRHVARGLARSLQLRLSEKGVQFGGWAFLRILWEEDGLSQRELSERAGLTQSTTHTALKKLEDLGYVTRRHPEGDRKKRVVFLTREGRAVRKQLQPMAEEVNAISVTRLSDDDVKQLRKALLIMARNLDQDQEAKQAQQKESLPNEPDSL